MKQWISVAGWLIAASVSLMATGPRITGAMFTSVPNEIVAIESAPFYTNQYPTGGMLFEIVTAALSSEEQTATLTTYPVQKMVNYYLTQEKVLGALGTTWNLSAAEKKKVVAFPISIVHQHYYYYRPFHPKGISWGGKLSNLKGFRYGSQEGADTDMYTKAGITVVYGRSLSLFKKLEEGSVDFVGNPDLSTKAIVDTNFAADKNQFAVMEPAPKEVIGMLLFNRQNPDAEVISKKFRKGMTTILKNGQYQTIIEKYEGKTPLASQHIEKFKTLWEKELLKK